MTTREQDNAKREALYNIPSDRETYEAAVTAAFNLQCDTHNQDRRYMYHRLRYPKDVLRQYWNERIGIREAGEQLYYRAVHYTSVRSMA